MKALKTLFTSLLVLVVLGFLGGTAWAIPSSQALYTEYDLGGGLWGYDYILYNTSDPVVDAGYDLYDFTLYFDPAVTITNILSPSDWDFISNESPSGSGNYYDFIDWMSLLPGEPPSGADIAPGTSLSGFSFTSNMQLASLSFDMFLSNPTDPATPVPYSGNTSSVPEPSTRLLLGVGLAGAALLRKRFKGRS